MSDQQRLDLAFQKAAAAGLIEFPFELAQYIDLLAFDTWAKSKLGSGNFEFAPDSPGSSKGCAAWATAYDDIQYIIGMSVYDQLEAQLLDIGEPL